MMAASDRLVASTEALGDVIRRELGAGCPIAVIGDGVETRITGARATAWNVWLRTLMLHRLLAGLARDRAAGATALVWFGNHGSPNAGGGLADLAKIQPVLEAVAARHRISLTIISNSWVGYVRKVPRWRVRTRYVSWHPETFLEALRAHAIAVIPIAR